MKYLYESSVMVHVYDGLGAQWKQNVFAVFVFGDVSVQLNES